MLRRHATQVLGFVLAGLVATSAGAARAGEHGLCAVLDSPFGLDEIVETAVGEVPGEPLHAGFSVQPTGEGEPETLFKVKIKEDDGSRALLFYDTETGDRVLPVAPALSLLEAYDAAVVAVETAAGTEGAVVLKGKLHRRVFVSNYDFAIADPSAKLAIARVNAQNGEVVLLRPRDVARKLKKRKLARDKRIYRHISGRPIRCDGIDEDIDLDEEALLDD